MISKNKIFVFSLIFLYLFQQLSASQTSILKTTTRVLTREERLTKFKMLFEGLTSYLRNSIKKRQGKKFSDVEYKLIKSVFKTAMQTHTQIKQPNRYWFAREGR